MIRTYNQNYMLIARDAGRLSGWMLESRHGRIDRFIPYLWGAAEQQIDSVFAPVIHLSTFCSFAALAQDPNQLSAWAKTLDTAVRGGVCTAVVGLAVGYGLALPVWPLVLAGGAVGAVAMGAYQYDALRPAKRFASALTEMADIATQAEGAPPHALAGLRGDLQNLVRLHAEAGTAMYVLAAKLDRMLASGQ